MKKWLVLIGLLICSCSTEEPPRSITAEVGKVSVIPQPRYTNVLSGQFLLTSETQILATSEDEGRMARYIHRVVYDACQISLQITDVPRDSNTIQVSVFNEPGLSLPDEYLLRVQTDKVELIGPDRGIFYGIQSLAQILPMECNGAAFIPAVEIYDSPRFPYRGMHLDVARHFMPPDFVKRYIRLLSKYKFNYFHWHLTDDQGWRIEIKKYPLLTEIGSRRRETVVGKNYNPYIGDRKPVEGFYTQDEIRDIVEFARRHYVTIVPEIDMPGHSSAALAAYPNLGCRDGYKYQVQTTWGGFPDILCPSDETMQFVRDVLDEVIELFPDSPYIHTGADEVVFDHWVSSEVVGRLKRTNNLKTEEEVFGWFLAEVNDHLRSRGKQMIGWDEMLPVAPSGAVVMSWQGMQPGITAVNAGRQVIMSPNSHTYLDRPHSDSPAEPVALGKPLSLQQVYAFDPVPSEIGYHNQDLVLGGQGCVWTEFIKRPQNVEYMVFPRAIALAEALWSQRSSRSFVKFMSRLSNELLRLDQEKVNYRKILAVSPPAASAMSDSPVRQTQTPFLKTEKPKTHKKGKK